MKSLIDRLDVRRPIVITTGGAVAAAATLTVVGFLYAAAVFQPDVQPTGWVAPPRLTDPDVSIGDTVMYRSYFNRVDWTGNLFAFPVKLNGDVDWQHQKWGTGNGGGGAAEVLDAQNWNTQRKIITLNNVGNKIAFRWGPLGTGFGIANGANPPDPLSQSLGDKTEGPKVLNYVRGDRSNELEDVYRIRNSVLGDMVHSQPAYYQYDKNKAHVFVGANDGMLHAFDAKDGKEVFAYIPSMLIPRLASLKEMPYTHKYFVDGSPAVRKVTINGVDKVYLVGGIGAGGSGVGTEGVDGLYALDVSEYSPNGNETQIAGNTILWELTPTTRAVGGTKTPTTDYQNLGQVYGAPLIVRVNSGNKWAAIVGNGYNSGTGKSSLYVIDVANGNLIQEIVADPSGTAANPGGLSKPAAVDTDGDGIIDLVYAGDINGKLYRFNLTSTNAGNWTATNIFDAKLAITGAPSVKFHSLGGAMVTFGTGRMFTAGNNSDATDKSSKYAVYGIHDTSNTLVTDSKLVVQKLTERTHPDCVTGSCRVRITTNNAVDLSDKKGWKLELPDGERVVGDGGFINTQGRYAFTSTNPTVVNPDIGAVIPDGENWLMEVQYDSGAGSQTPFLDLNGDGVVNADDVLEGSGNASRVPMARLISYGVASQPVLGQLAANSRSYVNTNADVSGLKAPDANECSGVCDGHFDWDIYAGCSYDLGPGGVATGWGGCSTHNHTHQWDDKYNVTGVNMLKPSKPETALTTVIPANSAQGFKIIVAGQRLSPSISLLISSTANAPVSEYFQAINYTTSATLDLATLPTWSMSGHGQTAKLATFIINLPKNAFSTRMWEQQGVAACTPAPGIECRVGVQPNQTGCVTSNKSNNIIGEPEMVGSFTIQIIKDSATNSDIEPNVNGQPKMGWRLKHNAQAQNKMLAMYTLFWHASGAGCYLEADYNPNPPPVPDEPGGSPPAGSGDPVEGTTIGGNVEGGTTLSVLLANFITGSNQLLQSTRNSNGTTSTTASIGSSSGGGGTAVTPGSGEGGAGGRESTTRLFTGRLSWREVIRQ